VKDKQVGAVSDDAHLFVFHASALNELGHAGIKVVYSVL
jgi:hypothetical protein